MNSEPRLLVYSSLFPSAAQPGAGLFIRERMFRVGKELPLTVVSPRPWFPGQGLIRRLRPGYRPMPGARESQSGFAVHFPRFLSLPGALRHLDGLFMALGTYPLLKRLRARPGFDVIDAHFAYPDGYAATLLGRWLAVPVTITLRGTEVRHARDPAIRRRVQAALAGAARVFSVSDSLRRLAIELGMPPEKGLVVGNGVDIDKFYPMPRAEARARLGVPAGAQVLITVGALVERKGFHQVIDLLPRLLGTFPDLHYLAVGGPSPEGDWTERLQARARSLGVAERVRFLGQVPPEELRLPLSAADVFVLPTRNEGWANVILEAMACGLPVVTTDVGGNREVVCREELGSIVAYADGVALETSVVAALRKRWDRQAILAYAHANDWNGRVAALVNEFHLLSARTSTLQAGAVAPMRGK